MLKKYDLFLSKTLVEKTSPRIPIPPIVPATHANVKSQPARPLAGHFCRQNLAKKSESGYSEVLEDSMNEPIGAGLTFEKVWASIQALSEQMKDTDARIKATNEEIKATREELKASGVRMERVIKATNKQIGFLSNRFGQMVEHMVLPNLVTQFEKLGYTFTKAHRTKLWDKELNIHLEVDALMENGDRVLAVETKLKPTDEDIDEHIERIDKLRRYADFHNDKRIYLGGIAGVVFGDSQKEYALKKGLFVIEPSGKTFKITVPSGDGQPREW